MTARRKDDGNLEVLSWGKGTNTYRFILLGAVLAATPIGQNVLNGIGVRTPVMDEMAKVKVDFTEFKTKTEAAQARTDSTLEALSRDVKEVKAKTDTLSSTITGFQIDFEKYNKKEKP